MKARHFKSRHALLMSLTSLMLCVSMLFGATFAWFTDSVTSGVNRIVSGNLDVEITHQTAGGTAEPVSSTTKLFTKDMTGKDLLWEPEVMAYETFTVSNVGTLNLKYQMNVNKVGENNLDNHVLADVIRVAVVDGTTVTRDASLFANAPTLAAFVQNPVSLANFTNATGRIDAGTEAQSFTIMLYWPEDGSTYALTGQNDNDYNVNNTSVASDGQKYLWVDLGITLLATQETGEYDSFDNQYDASSTQPSDGWSGVNTASMIKASATNAVATEATGTENGNTMTYAAKDTTVTDDATDVSAKVPASALASYAKTVVTNTEEETTTTTTTETELDLKVTPTSASNAVLTAATGDSSTSLYYDIDMTAITTKTVAVNNTVDAEQTETTSEAVTATDDLIEVTLPIGENLDLQGIYHKTTKLTTSANGDGEYYAYNADTGILTLYVNSFSPFSIAYKFAGGLGTEVAPYLIANREQMQAISEEENYAYYKWNGASTVDASNWKSVVLYGSFDGNNVVLNNLDETLFARAKNNDDGSAVEITNMTLNCEIFAYGATSALIYTAPQKLDVVNVNVHGQVVGYSVGGYVCYGAGNLSGYDANSTNWQVKFKNCYNDATLVAFAEGCGGFIQHPLCDISQAKDSTSVGNAQSLISIEDSAYTGVLKAVSNLDYFAYQGNHIRVKAEYSEAFVERLGYNPEGTLYKNMSKFSDGVFDAGNYSGASAPGDWVSNGNYAGAYRPGDTSGKYKIKITGQVSVPSNLGESYSFTKAEGASVAKVSFMISPNDKTNETGSYTSAYMNETIDLTSIETGSTVQTDSIKYWKIAINADGANSTGLVGNTYNVCNTFYGKTHNGASIYVVQYSAAGEVMDVGKASVWASNAVNVRVNGQLVKAAGAGNSYTYDYGQSLEGKTVTVRIYDRKTSTWTYTYEESEIVKTLADNTDYTIDGSKIVFNNIEGIKLRNSDLYNYFKEYCRYDITIE